MKGGTEMRIIPYNENMLDACSEFWWRLYGEHPYVIRPDGYEHPNTPSVGPHTFKEQIQEALSGHALSHWQGEVCAESIMLVEEEGSICGIMLSAVNREEHIGYIRSGFMVRDVKGAKVADFLLDETLTYLRRLGGLERVVLGPSWALEAESPLHIAALNVGFACEDKWTRMIGEEDIGEMSDPGYEAYMGGPLKHFRLGYEIKQTIKRLREQGITFRRCTLEEARSQRRLDTCQPPDIGEREEGFVFMALTDERVVGYTWQEPCWGGPDFIAPLGGSCHTLVLPSHRRRGIGKVLLHLAMEELVRQGAEYGFGGACVYDPVRRIMSSVGFRYWYMAFPQMTKELE